MFSFLACVIDGYWNSAWFGWVGDLVLVALWCFCLLVCLCAFGLFTLLKVVFLWFCVAS